MKVEIRGPILNSEVGGSSVHRNCRNISELYQMIRELLILLSMIAPALHAQSGMDIKYHRLEIALDPAVRFVSGSVSTWFVPTPGNRQVISFDLSDSLTGGRAVRT